MSSSGLKNRAPFIITVVFVLSPKSSSIIDKSSYIVAFVILTKITSGLNDSKSVLRSENFKFSD